MHNSIVAIPSITWFVLVLILGIIAILISVVKENGPSASAFWFWCAIWCTALAFLS